MRTILVAGGAGFIGSHVVEALLSRGDQVICLDNLADTYDPKIKLRNLSAVLQHPLLHFYTTDIRDKAALTKVLDSIPITGIIHLAALAGVRPSIDQPLLYGETNITGTLNLLECAKVKGIQRFVFASSSSVYGNHKVIPFSEHHDTNCPISPYAATKKAGEVLCYTYSQLSAMKIVCLRLFTVYGPRNRPDLMVSKFAEDISAGREIIVFGEGEEVMRDWTYVDDIVEGILKSLDAPAPGSYEIINLGNSSPVPVMKLVRLLEKGLGTQAKIRRAPLPPGDVLRTFADISRAQKLLGWSPQVTFEDGLKRFLNWKLSRGT